MNTAVRALGSSNLHDRRKRPNGQEDAHCFPSIFQMLAQVHLISNSDLHPETELKGNPGNVVFSSPIFREKNELQLDKPVDSIGRKF